jgi:hypothetical protein
MAKKGLLGFLFLLLVIVVHAQQANQQRKLTAKRITTAVKVDGDLTDAIWKDAPVANQFVELRPTPNKPEDANNATNIYIVYNDEGIYIGGMVKEKSKDSIASELIGRDGFGNNDFIGVIFDTYYDKLNGFGYFITPLGEQMDAKYAPNPNGNNEDFSWNAVWQSAAKINTDGWSFEMFIPFSAIRFGKMKIQDWGMNIIRRRKKSGQDFFWNPLDPVVNGFLTQEGKLLGLENLKPPLRLQFSPYFSYYYEKPADAKNWKSRVSGGMDVKYGLNQAFTLDMTLIPDFGQVVTDNKILNLTPFDVRFQENRPFFTEGVDLFNKGNLFYSRRIGVEPNFIHDPTTERDSTISNPGQAKIVNATKISGRTQKGLGIGILNAVTSTQKAVLYDTVGKFEHIEETMPLTNYNVFVLDQTLKNNSSVSLVNTNVMRSGKDYDANVTAALFDFNDKKNTWNVGGNVSVSNLIGQQKKTITGYSHSIYFGKTSGRFNFNVWQDLSDAKYDKSDLGYFTNNNTMDQGAWFGYNWNKPKGWYNQLRINTNFWYSRLVTPIDVYKGKENMFQGAGINFNLNAQTKRLWWIGLNINAGANYTDFYEARVTGRIFKNTGRIGASAYFNSNEAKKLSWGGNFSAGTGGVTKRVSFEPGIYGKIRFNSKFSIDHSLNISIINNQPGWAFNIYNGNGPLNDSIFFSRRNLRTVENVLNIKYSFTNKMGLTFRARHYWSKVDPQQFYLLNKLGNLENTPYTVTKNVNQNYNFYSVDMVYTWQFAQGSFINVVWKTIADEFTREFKSNYFSNLQHIVSGAQSNSLSVRVIYFVDYLTAKHSLQKRPTS